MHNWYTIKPGDSLDAIAQRFFVDREGLYDLNKSTLDQAAINHGKQSSNGGTLIYPGTTIVIANNGTMPYYGDSPHAS